jgi:ABC-type glycerol-3-phosphate transport system permease component
MLLVRLLGMFTFRNLIMFIPSDLLNSIKIDNISELIHKK